MMIGGPVGKTAQPDAPEQASPATLAVAHPPPPAPLLTQPSPTLTQLALPAPPSAASPPARTLVRAQAQFIAGELFKAGAGGWTGWGTEENRLVTLLEPLTAPDIGLVSEEYSAAHPSSLESDLIAEMDGNPTGIAFMRALLKGKENASQIQNLSIQAQMEGVYGDKAGAIAQLASMTPAQRQAAADAYARSQGLTLSGRPARQHLSQAFQEAGANQAEMQRFQWLILPPSASDCTEDWASGQTSFQAEQLLSAFHAHDLKKVDTLLENIAPDRLPAIQKAFDIQVGQPGYADGSRPVTRIDLRTLAQRIQQRPDSPSKRILLLRLNPRPQDPVWQADILNWQIDASLDGQNEVAQLHALLEAADPTILPLAQKRYDQTHPETLDTRLQNELLGNHFDHALRFATQAFSGPPSHADWAKTQLLLTRPSASDPRFPVWKSQFDAWALVGAKDGMGADAERIKATLAANSEPDQIKRLDQSFRQITGQTLRQTFVPTNGVHRYTDVFAELGSRDQLQVDQLLQPRIDPKDKKAATAQQLDWRIAQVEKEREIGPATFAMNMIWPGYSIQKAKGIDPLVQTEKLMRWDLDYQSSDERLKASLEQAKRAFQAGDFDQTQRYLGLTDLHYDSYVDTQKQASEVAALTLGTSAAFVASAGTATPVLAGALWGGGTAALVRAGTTLEGDAIRFGIEGAASGALAGVPMHVFRAANVSTKTALEPFKRGRKLWWAHHPPQLLSGIKKGHLQVAWEGAKAGAFYGAASGGTHAALDRQTWEKGLVPGVGTVLRAGGQSALIDGGIGAALAGMFSVGMQGVKDIRTHRAEKAWRGDMNPPFVPKGPVLQGKRVPGKPDEFFVPGKARQTAGDKALSLLPPQRMIRAKRDSDGAYSASERTQKTDDVRPTSKPKQSADAMGEDSTAVKQEISSEPVVSETPSVDGPPNHSPQTLVPIKAVPVTAERMPDVVLTNRWDDWRVTYRFDSDVFVQHPTSNARMRFSVDLDKTNARDPRERKMLWVKEFYGGKLSPEAQREFIRKASNAVPFLPTEKLILDVSVAPLFWSERLRRNWDEESLTGVARLALKSMMSDPLRTPLGELGSAVLEDLGLWPGKAVWSGYGSVLEIAIAPAAVQRQRDVATWEGRFQSDPPPDQMEKIGQLQQQRQQILTAKFAAEKERLQWLVREYSIWKKMGGKLRRVSGHIRNPSEMQAHLKVMESLDSGGRFLDRNPWNGFSRRNFNSYDDAPEHDHQETFVKDHRARRFAMEKMAGDLAHKLRLILESLPRDVMLSNESQALLTFELQKLRGTYEDAFTQLREEVDSSNLRRDFLADLVGATTPEEAKAISRAFQPVVMRNDPGLTSEDQEALRQIWNDKASGKAREFLAVVEDYREKIRSLDERKKALARASEGISISNALRARQLRKEGKQIHEDHQRRLDRLLRQSNELDKQYPGKRQAEFIRLSRVLRRESKEEDITKAIGLFEAASRNASIASWNTSVQKLDEHSIHDLGDMVHWAQHQFGLHAPVSIELGESRRENNLQGLVDASVSDEGESKLVFNREVPLWREGQGFDGNQAVHWLAMYGALDISIAPAFRKGLDELGMKEGVLGYLAWRAIKKLNVFSIENLVKNQPSYRSVVLEKQQENHDGGLFPAWKDVLLAEEILKHLDIFASRKSEESPLIHQALRGEPKAMEQILELLAREKSRYDLIKEWTRLHFSEGSLADLDAFLKAH